MRMLEEILVAILKLILSEVVTAHKRQYLNYHHTGRIWFRRLEVPHTYPRGFVCQGISSTKNVHYFETYNFLYLITSSLARNFNAGGCQSVHESLCHGCQLMVVVCLCSILFKC